MALQVTCILLIAGAYFVWAFVWKWQVEKRLLALSPGHANEQNVEPNVPLNSKVLELVTAALDPVKQISMPCLWHPWA